MGDNDLHQATRNMLSFSNTLNVIEQNYLDDCKDPIVEEFEHTGSSEEEEEEEVEIQENEISRSIVFEKIKDLASKAIISGIYPTRIPQGSSGSYFVHDIEKNIIAVFKPKNEEPYGEMNPKWTKWFHKNLCPCLFGRSCLLPNQGYLSEVGASIVDQYLHLNIVPRTEIVCMISETFYYSKLDRANVITKQFVSETFPDFIGRHLNLSLPPKIGSLQQYVNGYRDASFYLDKFKSSPLPSGLVNEKFQMEFEKLVILDYIIRNTDRNSDNWLIRIEKAGTSDENTLDTDDSETTSAASLTNWTDIHDIDVKIAAIDNGLAFPYKHPDSWRWYPFHWSSLSYADIPFTQNAKMMVLPFLKDPRYVEKMVSHLYHVFSKDKRFIKTDFKRQMAVMRGQITGLVYALENSLTPRELTELPPAYLHPVTSTRRGETSYVRELETNPPFFRSF